MTAGVTPRSIQEKAVSPLRASEDHAARGGHAQQQVHPGCCSSGPGGCPVLLPPWGGLGPSCPSSHSPGPNNPGSDSFPSSEVIDFQGEPEPVQSSVLGGLWTSTPGKGNWSAQAGNHRQVACSPGPKRSLKKACGEGLSQHLNEWGWGPTQGSCLLRGRMRHTSAAHLPGSRGRRAPAGVGPQLVSAKPRPQLS